jgi:hypothetical protein
MTMRTRFAAAVTACAVVVCAPVARGHHSFAVEFDREIPVKVTGTVRKVEWTNPHIWYYVEGTDEHSGERAVWGFSAASPNSLRRRGIGRDSMQPGDTVIVEGFRARDGSPNASGGRVTFEDGSQVFTASVEDARPE